MKALIFENKVVQVEEESFPVAPELTWIDDISSDVEVGFLYKNKKFKKPEGWDNRNVENPR